MATGQHHPFVEQVFSSLSGSTPERLELDPSSRTQIETTLRRAFQRGPVDRDAHLEAVFVAIGFLARRRADRAARQLAKLVEVVVAPFRTPSRSHAYREEMANLLGKPSRPTASTFSQRPSSDSQKVGSLRALRAPIRL